MMLDESQRNLRLIAATPHEKQVEVLRTLGDVEFTRSTFDVAAKWYEQASIAYGGWDLDNPFSVELLRSYVMALSNAKQFDQATNIVEEFELSADSNEQLSAASLYLTTALSPHLGELELLRYETKFDYSEVLQVAMCDALRNFYPLEKSRIVRCNERVIYTLPDLYDAYAKQVLNSM
jgi:hypothetical protein